MKGDASVPLGARNTGRAESWYYDKHMEAVEPAHSRQTLFVVSKELFIDFFVKLTGI